MMLLVKNLSAGTLMTCSCGQFYLNFHQAHACMHPFTFGMINNYYSHSSMALLFFPFISRLIPIAYELAIVSEEEIKKREQKSYQNMPQGMFI
jgi:hypothetical protein